MVQRDNHQIIVRNYSYIISSDNDNPSTQVRFAEDNDLCEVHRMVQWSYAYQQARKGPWEEYARDRDRFSKRIKDLESVLSPVFDSQHRESVYNKIFKDSVTC
ncbi:unnamed protein product [Callosobruchus maculatus]|uniref:Protein DP71L n=1 Tax=Callosobruchus maculatus TaxID=64391 RepID=A0A653BL44_CALMS|nr:unnamed protein product [Callosobruchus maculatus]